jgi:hypothetical protein
MLQTALLNTLAHGMLEAAIADREFSGKPRVISPRRAEKGLVTDPRNEVTM